MREAWPGRFERIGQALFRWRSFTPLPLLIVAIPLLLRSRGGGGPVWTGAGIALCAAGQAVRAWVLGQVPDGTSGQNERLIATELNTSGPYARTRNPLYLGNFLITLGVCLVAHDPILLGLVAVLFAAQYRAIVAAEEGFLRTRFGPVFDEYCARVPRFWPRLGAASRGAGPPCWSLSSPRTRSPARGPPARTRRCAGTGCSRTWCCSSASWPPGSPRKVGSTAGRAAASPTICAAGSARRRAEATLRPGVWY